MLFNIIRDGFIIQIPAVLGALGHGMVWTALMKHWLDFEDLSKLIFSNWAELMEKNLTRGNNSTAGVCVSDNVDP